MSFLNRIGSGDGQKHLLRIYTVYDRLAEEAGPVFCAVNDAVASRSFRGLLQESGVVSEDDYRLYFLACYDPKTCKLTAEVNPVEVMVVAPRQLDLIKDKE